MSNAVTQRNRLTKVWENRTAKRAIKSTIILVPATLFIVLQTPIKINTSIEGKVGLEIVIGNELVDTVEVVAASLSDRQDLDKTTDIESWPAFPAAAGYGGNATWGLKPTFRAIQASVFGFPIAFKFVGRAGTILGAAAPNDSVCNRTNANVHFVTTTGATGIGSLQDIIENQLVDDTMDYVIFRTGGTTSSVTITPSANCLYVAGQTAPGDGFQAHHSSGSQVLDLPRNLNGTNSIWRYLRFRSHKGTPGAQDVVTVLSGRNIIFDHVSAQYGNDETFTLTTVGTGNSGNNIAKVTIQWSIIGPGLRLHSTGTALGRADDMTTRNDSSSWHHNLWVHNSHRNPRIVANEPVELINNIVYNWKNKVGGFCRGPDVDIVRNYWKGGPWAPSAARSLMKNCNLGSDPPSIGTKEFARLFVLGQVLDSLGTVLKDSTADQEAFFTFDSGSALDDSMFSASRFANPVIAVTEHSAAQAYDSILDVNIGAGVTRRLDCDGTWLLAQRDTLENLLVNHVLNNTGPSTNEENDHPDDYPVNGSSGIPSLSAGTACTDTDSDGMPDVWEDANGLDKNDGTDFTSDADGDGYIALEEYLNGTTP